RIRGRDEARVEAGINVGSWMENKLARKGGHRNHRGNNDRHPRHGPQGGISNWQPAIERHVVSLRLTSGAAEGVRKAGRIRSRRSTEIRERRAIFCHGLARCFAGTCDFSATKSEAV